MAVACTIHHNKYSTYCQVKVISRLYGDTLPLREMASPFRYVMTSQGHHPIKVSKLDRYPIPWMRDHLAQLTGGKAFTKHEPAAT